MINQSLWPEFEVEEIIPPVNILKEQASYLAEQTKNVLTADVITSTGNAPTGQPVFYNYLNITAPALDNYSFTLLRVDHGIYLFPINVRYQLSPALGLAKCDDIESFIKALQDAFQHEATKKIISALIAQST